jgi:hypothetical protein
LTTGLGAPGGSAEGGADEFEELRFSCTRSSWSSACNWAIWRRASCRATRRWPHSGQGVTGLEDRSFIKDDTTGSNGDCKNLDVFRPAQALLMPRGGAGRLPKWYVGRTAPLACGAATSDQSHRRIGPNHSAPGLLDRQLGKPHVLHLGGSPTAREGDGIGGKRCRRKRRPPCNGADRAARAGDPTRKGADFRRVLRREPLMTS